MQTYETVTRKSKPFKTIAKMSRFIKALLANPFRFKFSIEKDNVFLDVGIVWILLSLIPWIL